MRLGAPWHWYKLDSIHALELLNTFAKRTEIQIATAIDHYKTNKETDFIVLSEQERIGQAVTHYDGLDDMSWDLEELFTSHFPNLQRKSAFLTLYAFLENELEKLANKLQHELSLSARQDDIAGKGIYRSFSYMQLIVNLEIEKGDNRWSRISQINKLRNMMIHGEGQLSSNEQKRESEEKFADSLKDHLTIKDSELVLGPTFLRYVLDQFNALFEYIDAAIQLKFSTKRSRKGPPKKTRVKLVKVKRKSK
jgi:hypothetical protein